MRNHVIVANATAETGSVVRRIASLVDGVVPVVHQHGYAQFLEDAAQSFCTLVGNAAHPNVAAALFVGLGDEWRSRPGDGRGGPGSPVVGDHRQSRDGLRHPGGEPVAGGELSCAERHGHSEFSIWRLAETI